MSPSQPATNEDRDVYEKCQPHSHDVSASNKPGEPGWYEENSSNRYTLRTTDDSLSYRCNGDSTRTVTTREPSSSSAIFTGTYMTPELFHFTNNDGDSDWTRGRAGHDARDASEVTEAEPPKIETHNTWGRTSMGYIWNYECPDELENADVNGAAEVTRSTTQLPVEPPPPPPPQPMGAAAPTPPPHDTEAASYMLEGCERGEVYSDSRTYICDKCRARFSGTHAKDNLARHKIINHKYNSREYPCEMPSCGHIYRRADALLRHHRKRHGESEP